MLAAVFFAEHGYFALQHLVKTMLASLPPPFSTMEKRRQFERQRQIILDLVDHDVAAGRWGGRVIKKKETTLDDQESVVDYGVALKRIHEGIKIE